MRCRHVIGSLPRKLGAFARYAYREALLPKLVFQQTYGTAQEGCTGGADLECLRILHLNATRLEAAMDAEPWCQQEALSA